MKVDSQNVSGQVACPSCGTMFGGDDPEVAEIQDFPEPTEVITGGGGAQDLQAGTDLPDLHDLALEDELAPVPRRLAQPAQRLPRRRSPNRGARNIGCRS